MHLSKKKFTCPKIMHKQHSLVLTVLLSNVKTFLKDINSIENSVNLLKKPADQDPHCFPKQHANLKQLIKYKIQNCINFIFVPGQVYRNF